MSVQAMASQSIINGKTFTTVEIVRKEQVSCPVHFCICAWLRGYLVCLLVCLPPTLCNAYRPIGARSLIYELISY